MARWAALIVATGIALAVNYHASGQQVGVARTNPYFQRLASSIVTIPRDLVLQHGPGSLVGIRAAADSLGTPTWGTDVLISTIIGTSPQNEVSLAAHRVTPSTFIAGANDYRSLVDSSCGLYRSTDTGATWSDLGTLREEAGTIGIILEAAGDPAVAFDRQGYAYYGCLYFTRAGGGAKGSIFVHRSTNSGLSFGAPISVAVAESVDTFHDKEHVATGPAPIRCGSAASCNNIYVSWTEFDTETAVIRFARSTNNGLSFAGAPKGPWLTISDSTANQGSNICTNASGHALVVWTDYSATAPSTGRIRSRRSTTEGASFGPIATVASIFQTPSPLGNGAQFRVNSFPVCAADPANSSRWFVTWAALPTEESVAPNIYFSVSSDGGATWAAPQIVDNVSTGTFFPWMTVDASTVVWIIFGARTTTNGPGYQIRIAHRHYLAATTWTNQQISNAASSASCQFGGEFIGDYFGLAHAGGTANKVVAGWTDTRSCSTRGQDVFGDRATPTAAPAMSGERSR